MTTNSRALRLTPKGEVVFSKDPELGTLTTQWFLHHELCTDPERAEAWHHFAYEFLPNRKSFSIEELERSLAMKLMSHHPKHFGMGSNMIKVIARKQIQCYTQAEGLGEIGLVTKEAVDCYRIHKPRVGGPWDTKEQLVQAYS
jgi:hypothetical protein